MNIDHISEDFEFENFNLTDNGTEQTSEKDEVESNTESENNGSSDDSLSFNLRPNRSPIGSTNSRWLGKAGQNYEPKKGGLENNQNIKIGKSLPEEMAEIVGDRLGDAAKVGTAILTDMGIKAAKDFVESQIGKMTGDEVEALKYGVTPRSKNAISYEPDPIRIHFNTGIKNHVYGKLILGNDFNSSHVHLTSAYVFFPTSTAYATNPLGYYLSNVIYPRFVQAAQSKINFQISLTTFSEANIVSYINTVALALQRYYSFASILTYNANPYNRHVGMEDLRDSMTANNINDFYYLGEVLRHFPLPKALNDFVFYISQNFLRSEVTSSEIIKITPFPFVQTSLSNSNFLMDSGVNYDGLSASITSLNSTTNTTIASVLARVQPDWLLTKLKDVPIEPIYDPTFTTIWCNLPGLVSYTNAAPTYTHSVAGLDSSVIYSSYVDDLDGGAVACASIANSTNSQWVPGILNPNTFIVTKLGASAISNRVSFFTDSTLTYPGWYIPTYSNQLAAARGETYTYNTSGGVYGFKTVGSNIVDGVTGNAILQSAYQFTEMLWGINELNKNFSSSEFSNQSIKRGSGNSSQSSRSKSKFYDRRRKSKAKITK